jgi:hypothetical protein
MDNPSSSPTFEARHLASATGWYVRVAWSNGTRDHIPGFVSHREAQRWIEENAPAWLSAQSARASFGHLATALGGYRNANARPDAVFVGMALRDN